jgi:hypothetical protein
MGAIQQQRVLGLERQRSPAPASRLQAPALPRALPTGLEAVDRNLPGGGLPCGRMTELVGTRGSGRTSFLLAVMARLARQGERSALVDLRGDLDPLSLLDAGIPEGWVWVVRPTRGDDALWAADLLLRSGHFRLVWLDGLERGVPTGALVRLQRQARESDAAVVVGVEGPPVSAPGSLRLMFRSLGLEWAPGLSGVAEPVRSRVAIGVGKGQTEALVSFECRPARLLGAHPLIADRRPAGWTDGERLYAAAWRDEAPPDRLAEEVFGGERRGPIARPPGTEREEIRVTDGPPRPLGVVTESGESRSAG